MAKEFIVRIDEAGRATIAPSGQAGAAPASRPAPSAATPSGQPAPSPQQSREQAQSESIARRVRGDTGWAGAGSDIPWFLDPTSVFGSAARRTASAAFNPMMSGGEQGAIAATQGARAAAYAPYSAAAAAAPTAGAADSLRELGTAIADAVGASVERAMQRQAMTSGAATRTVQGVAAGLARAGVDIAAHEDDFRRLLDRQNAQERLAYDAMTQIAQWSGNPLAGAVRTVQQAVDEGMAAGRAATGMSDDAFEVGRQAATLQKQTNRATKGR